jgi:Holliday junction resolvase RusA-like endonuclease
MLAGVRQRFVINAVLPGFNELRGMNPFAYNKCKQRWGGVVKLSAQAAGIQPVTTPTRFSFHFLEPHARRDPDGIAAGALKITLDALTRAGFIPDDSQKWVSSIQLTWEVSKTPGVMITMESE